MELISPMVIIILCCLALFLLLQRKNLRRPPCIKGWIPWIGVGFEFGKAPLEFIEKARIKLTLLFDDDVLHFSLRPEETSNRSCNVK
ncbi:hypothetical protein P7K49_008075 [Saguinus oedipus]|uniref:Cytochrome P450 n=1 Tax=Saguinus oedipus TaxID=9490 RepID=A0ABQ9VWP2_SAGOE|nr:hypothetical protein P7K49_008075 [Saguinus oedipus]